MIKSVIGLVEKGFGIQQWGAFYLLIANFSAT